MPLCLDRLTRLKSDRVLEGIDYGPSEFISHDDLDLSNFARACASNSPLRRSERGERTDDFSGAVRSFIWDHSKAADICQHPEVRKLHGHTMDIGVPLGPLVPLFTFAKTRLHADILATPMEQWVDHYDEYEPPWDQKSRNKLFWRGEPSLPHDPLARDRDPKRYRAMKQERRRESNLISTHLGDSRSELDCTC